MLLFSDLGELTYNELFQENYNLCLFVHPRKEKSVIHFNLALILIGFITQKRYMVATNGVMTQQEAKCTPNNQCKCIVSMKNRVFYYLKCTIFFE